MAQLELEAKAGVVLIPHTSQTIHPFSLCTRACVFLPARCNFSSLLPNRSLSGSHSSATVIRANMSATTTAAAVASYECVAGYTLVEYCRSFGHAHHS